METKIKHIKAERKLTINFLSRGNKINYIIHSPPNYINNRSLSIYHKEEYLVIIGLNVTWETILLQVKLTSLTHIG